MDAPNRAYTRAIVERTYMRRPDVRDPSRAPNVALLYEIIRERSRVAALRANEIALSRECAIAHRKFDASRKIPQSIC